MERAAIDEGFVRDLVRDQHPELADLEIRPVPSGWDNQLWRLGDELAVRLPMTGRAPALLRKEFRWLPELAKRLPLPIPTPQHFGEPTARFPRPWIVARWVPGEPADSAEISNVHQSVDNLAYFLRALHQPAPPQPTISHTKPAASCADARSNPHRLQLLRNPPRPLHDPVGNPSVPAQQKALVSPALISHVPERPRFDIHQTDSGQVGGQINSHLQQRLSWARSHGHATAAGSCEGCNKRGTTVTWLLRVARLGMSRTHRPTPGRSRGKRKRHELEDGRSRFIASGPARRRPGRDHGRGSVDGHCLPALRG
ncbi:phosphotransferase [Streptomyces canus]|uniref:phosphotransferase n=1 Tax=Streptomyces canus TaxID=58343 RepID=UPI003713E2FC